MDTFTAKTIDISTKVGRFQTAFEYLRYNGYIQKQKDLAVIMKTAAPNISNAMKGANKVLTDGFLGRFNASFNDMFNEQWLLTGEGEMLKKGGGVEVNGNKVTATNGGVAVTGNAHHFTANAAPSGCASPELEERVRKNEEQIRTHEEKLKSQEERIKSLEERFNLSQALIDEKERLIQVLMEKGKS